MHFRDTYIHYMKQQSDTGIKIDLLQEYVFIAIDIFRKKLHNKGVENKLEAWLTFLCEEEPDWILKLTEDYPEFKSFYGEVYEMQDTIDAQKEQLSQKDEQLSQMSETIKAMEQRMKEMEKQLKSQN